jgi:hypothetical protein
MCQENYKWKLWRESEAIQREKNIEKERKQYMLTVRLFEIRFAIKLFST